MEFSLKNILKFIIFMGIGFGLMAWAFNNMDLKKMVEAIKHANYFWILIAMICGVLSHVFRAVRWNLLLKPMGYKANNWNAFYAVMIGYFSNYLIPRVGEVTRCAALSKTDKIPVEKLIGTVLVERLVDMVITIVITFAIFISQFELLSNFINDSIKPLMGNDAEQTFPVKYIVLVVLLVIVITIYIVRKKIRNLTIYKKVATVSKGFITGLKSILKLERPFLFITYSLLIWCMYFASAYYTFFSYPPTAHFGFQAGLIVLFLGTIAIVIPVPGGYGTYHYLVGMGMMLFGITEDEGKTYATISHANQGIMVFVVGLFSMIMISKKLRKRITADDVI